MIFRYTFEQLVFFFLFYCMFGWVFESTYVSIKEKKFTNRGFMRGPFIPIYGCGAMMLLFSTTFFLKWPVLVFFAGMISCSILEYVTGWSMEKIFRVRYWDYSDEFCNINGHVCLKASLTWGAMALLLNYLLHKPVESLYNLMPAVVSGIVVRAVSIYFIVDLTLAVRTALDIRSMIIKIDQIKDEMRIMSKRLDVIIAVADDELDRRKQAVEDSFEELAQDIEDRLWILKDSIESKPAEISEAVKNEYIELRAKILANREHQKTWLKDRYSKATIKNNPKMRSLRFADSFEILKKRVSEITQNQNDTRK